MRVVTPILLTALALSIAIIIPAHATDLSLRKRTMVIDENVTVGDLFDNAGHQADKVLFSSPEPGERVLFTMREVKGAMNKIGIEWDTRLTRKHVIVERTGMKVPMNDIMEVIEQRLLDEGLDDNVRLKPSNRFISIHVPVEGYNRLEVENFDMDRQSGRVSSQLLVSAPGMDDKRFKVAGRIIYVTEVPTLSGHVAGHDVINANDIEWVSIESRKLRDGVVMNLDELLGMSPTRSIRPGQPIRRRDVRLPVVVAKGKSVVISFDIPGLSLTAKGKALDDGAQNEVIRVQNMQSDQTVTAKVISPNEVRVEAGFQTAMAN